MNNADFILPLADLGGGAVDKSLLRGAGSATFTRATAAATKLSTGLWKLDVASGVARSGYIGLTTAVSAFGGYVAEAAATQLALNPRDMTQAAWAVVTMTTAQTSTGIDGVGNSCTRITATGASSTILQTLVAAATSRTNSCWVKRITGTGTVLLKQGTATLDITALINSATFTLVQLNDNELNVAYGIQINTSGDALDVDCNQFEAGGIATTPIPAAGTRAADNLLFTFAGNASASVGSAYAELSTFWSTCPGGNGNVAINFSSGTTDKVLGSTFTIAATVIRTLDVAGNLASATGSSMQTGVRKVMSSWGGVTMSNCNSGGTVASSTFSGDMGSTGIGIGNRGDGSAGLEWQGTIQNVRIWLSQSPNSTLSALTA